MRRQQHTPSHQPPSQASAGTISLRVKQLDVRCDSKTRESALTGAALPEGWHAMQCSAPTGAGIHITPVLC